MSSLATDFVHTSDTKAFDLDHLRIINYNIAKYHIAVEQKAVVHISHNLPH